MATTIEEGYVYLTSSPFTDNDTITDSEGATVVKILVGGNVSHNFQNDIFFTPIPSTDYSQDPKVLNLAKVKEAITVTGIFETYHNGVVESVDAKTKKTNLLTLAKGKQPITIVYGIDANSNQTKHTDFNINKIQFKETPTTPYETVTERIEVTVQGLLGTSMV